MQNPHVMWVGTPEPLHLGVGQCSWAPHRPECAGQSRAAGARSRSPGRWRPGRRCAPRAASRPPCRTRPCSAQRSLSAARFYTPYTDLLKRVESTELRVLHAVAAPAERVGAFIFKTGTCDTTFFKHASHLCACLDPGNMHSTPGSLWSSRGLRTARTQPPPLPPRCRSAAAQSCSAAGASHRWPPCPACVTACLPWQLVAGTPCLFPPCTVLPASCLLRFPLSRMQISCAAAACSTCESTERCRTPDAS